MRLVLQHVSDPVRFLSSLKSAFRPGTRLFIIEEDNGLYFSEPSARRSSECWPSMGDGALQGGALER
jgi:hypothetical protein